MPDGHADKASRGRLLIVAGSAELAGAAILAANAAFRAGVGKVCIATERTIAAGVALAVPEARVVAADDRRRARQLAVDDADRFDALLVGPGITKPNAALRACMREASARVLPAVVDAGALELFPRNRRKRATAEPAFVVTPHMGEMARLTGHDKEDVEAHAAQMALEYAALHRAVVTLKGARTFVAHPDGGLWVHDESNVGLAISGSGDVLAGIVAGLAARGASCAQAAVWGVALHARAGRHLVADHGQLGGLARELPSYIPVALRELS